MRYFPGADQPEHRQPEGDQIAVMDGAMKASMDGGVKAAMQKDPNHPGKHIDSATGIWPISEWGSECGRGFVSLERFARAGGKVIKRANRRSTRKWYQRFAGKPERGRAA